MENNGNIIMQDEALYTKVADILRVGFYEEITEYVADRCVLNYPRYTNSVVGKELIRTILHKAYIHDHSRRFPITLSADVARTHYLTDESISETTHPVVYVHEDVFPPYHKTYIFLSLEQGIIERIDIRESAKIQLIRT